MNPDEWAELKRLFDKAIHISAAERTLLVAEVCDRDPELGDQLAALLKAHDQKTQSADLPLISYSPAPDRLFSDGEIILERFEIIRLLGTGGMGEVYEANDREMGRIALKTIRGNAYSNEQNLARLRQEVSIARQIASPYVCRIYEFFPIPPGDGRPGFACFTMEFLEGNTVSSHLKQHGPMSWPDAKRFARQICDGLTAIHQAGVIHRDLKSNNIMLASRKGQLDAVVMDFGLARRPQAASAAAGSGISRSGAVMGTPEYMAPEQFDAGDVSPATDIYAFGVVLYEMLTGKHPFKASSPMAAAVHRAKRLESVSSLRPDIPRHVDEVIQRCLQYEPSLRYQSAPELARPLSGHFQIAAMPKRTWWLSMRHPLWAALFCLSLIALIAALTFASRKPAPTISANATHWYEKGLVGLREGSYLTATTALQKAIRYDDKFALAHARLAEAWYELDFTGKAEHQLLLAASPEFKVGLSSLDLKYLDAIRHFVSEDFPAAIADYKLILRELPPLEKATGYLDLGRAEERAENIPEALKNYSQAALIPPETPAPFFHRAILEGRENQMDAADKDFSKAESLYRDAQNYEGLAEVNYQRGYVLTLHGQSPVARTLLEKSLQHAREMSSPQLEIRALTRLAVYYYGDSNDGEAIRLANQAIELAHDKDLDYWAVDARIRAANAYVDLGELDKADLQLRQALDLASQNRRSRLMALANLSLASLRDQQDNSVEAISYASAALNYYRRLHFINESINCSMLINRAKLNQGDFSNALEGGLETLGLARQTNNSATIYQVEEFVGSVNLNLQNYPAALDHFQAALNASRKAGQQVEYQLAHCANALWQLGRYPEAETMLTSIPPNASQAPEVLNQEANIQANISLSRLDYQRAIKFALKAAEAAKNLPADRHLEDQMLLLQAYSHLGLTKPAKEVFETLQPAIQKLHDPELSAHFDYASAVMFLTLGKCPEAQSSALSVLRFASASGQKESEWRALALLSSLSSKSGDPNAAREYASKALDIFSGFEHNWETSAYKYYVSRPDVRDEQLKLMLLVRR